MIIKLLTTILVLKIAISAYSQILKVEGKLKISEMNTLSSQNPHIIKSILAPVCRRSLGIRLAKKSLIAIPGYFLMTLKPLI